MAPKLKMAVLLSGTGRTLDNFHDHIKKGTLNASVEVVISNEKDVLGLTKAEKYGYPAFYSPDNDSINKILGNFNVDIIVLAGFLKLYIPPSNLALSVLNIHPSLIPSFCGAGYYGMNVHQAVFERGVTISGCTVHFANENYDEGPIVLQQCVKIDRQDDPHSIADKVFAAECLAFPAAINMVADNGIAYFWNNKRESLKGDK